MPKIRLDQNLLKKLARKTGKTEKYLREQISIRAGKLGVSSEAFLILWAKKEGIGTGVYQRKMLPHIQSEVRDTLPSIFVLSQQRLKPSVSQKKLKRQGGKPQLSLAVEYLIQDKELFDRCEDLIKAKKNFDRVFREATTILEDRIKKLSGIKNLVGINLVSKVLNPDPAKAVIKVSDRKFEQQGFFNICNGLILAFRDTTHHELSNKFTEQHALKFCGFIDSLLAVLEQTKKQNEN